jgi:hypothetical protein
MLYSSKENNLQINLFLDTVATQFCAALMVEALGSR